MKTTKEAARLINAYDTFIVQLIYMSIMAAVFLAVFGLQLFVFLARMLGLPFAFVIDFLTAFIRGISGTKNSETGAAK
jgi:hypothetical protein